MHTAIAWFRAQALLSPSLAKLALDVVLVHGRELLLLALLPFVICSLAECAALVLYQSIVAELLR